MVKQNSQLLMKKIGDLMYNPFNKNISEIEYDDLKKLIENDIAEDGL